MRNREIPSIRRYALLLVSALLVLSATPAVAAPPEELLHIPRLDDLAASGEAGRLSNPRGIATNPDNGHIFVADNANYRISEFTSWGSFVKAWGWGVADGSAELQTCGPAEPEPAPDPTLCRAGIRGSGAGQFNGTVGVAVDAAGNVYVVDIMESPGAVRVQKFSPEGDFLLMFGGEVNKTDHTNVCTQADLESGDQCGGGTLGTADGQFGSVRYGNYIAIGADGTVYVGDAGRIQEFTPDGVYKGEIPLEGPLAGGAVDHLAMDRDGNFYLVLVGEDQVRKLGPNGELLASYSVPEPTALAVDFQGNLYVAHDPSAGFGSDTNEPRVMVFDSSGAVIVASEEEFARPPAASFGSHLGGLATNVRGSEGAAATTPGDVYVSVNRSPSPQPSEGYIAAYGPLPQFEPAPPAPPTIAAQYATAVGTDQATLGADINPHFFAGTTYSIEYGTGKCSEGGCTASASVPLGAERDLPAATSPFSVGGLAPGTTYHYRFVAVSGPYVSKGLGDGEAGAEGTFTTRIPHPRQLADGRAYEMVSPPEKNSGDVSRPGSVGQSVAPLQASPTGGAFTFSSFTAFGEGPQSSPAANQYISRRNPSGGWSTQNLTPPDEESYVTDPLRGFSLDLSKAAVITLEPPLVPEAAQGYENLYVMDTASESLQLATPGVPQIQIERKSYCVGFGGASQDFSRVVFAARGALLEGDPQVSTLEGSNRGYNLYEWSAVEGLRLVSVLPNGNPAQPIDVTGFGSNFRICGATPDNYLANAVSADGSKIFWSTTENLYARVGGEETVQLDKKQGGSSGGGGRFWRASSDGSKVFFTSSKALTPGAAGGGLYRYDFDAPEGAPLENLSSGKGVSGVLGAAADGAAVYFASSAVLVGNEGPAGGFAQAEKPNLYLWQEGEGTRFLATMSNETRGSDSVDAINWSERSIEQSARVTPDGEHLAFVSFAPLSGYDNTSQADGRPASQVYLYDAAADTLRCASCNPTGARPLGNSTVPAWNTPSDQPRFLSDDGRRLFFKSEDSLEEADTNGKPDAYEFELPGTGSCSAQSPTFSARTGGCVELLSSGKGNGDSLFLDASTSGDDAFIATRDRLVPRDQDDNLDIYDVRVGGSEPPLPPPPVPCEGEACRGPASQPPPASLPGTSAFQGPGNPKAAIRCKKPRRKITRKGKTHCVKPKQKQKHKKRRHSHAQRRNSR
jgi:DNA-binding beta-propeller fold protein YncE